MELQLFETKHPLPAIQKQFDALVGIDAQKEALVDELTLILDPSRLETWRKKHHPSGLAYLDRGASKAPLILLSGDVGCGKTALSTSVCTPVSTAIDGRILALETPSDIRGQGHVGELSSRITDTFTQAKAKAATVGRGVLIIDEADDLATQRGQMQAHHEDRAGVNVLIKQIDSLRGGKVPMAVIMITNRDDAIDPAVLRRAALRLTFDRPDDKARAVLFTRILEGTKPTDAEIGDLVARTKGNVPYTFSDLTDRVAHLALRRSWKKNVPFGYAALKDAIAEVSSTPLMASKPK